MQHTAYLSASEIQILKDFNQYNSIQSVTYYYWVNTMNSEDLFTFKDTIEFVIDPKQSIFFKINEEDTGINILDVFDFEKQKAEIESEFQGKIKFHKRDASSLEIWQETLRSPFLEIKAESENTRLLNHTFMIAFEEMKLELNLHPVDGLVLSPYDDSLDD